MKNQKYFSLLEKFFIGGKTMYKLGTLRMNLWDEPFMQEMGASMELKVLYIYLLSNALSNIAGVYKITNRRIRFDLCNENLDLTALFASLKKMKKVYRCGDYVIVKDAPLYIKKMTKTAIKEMDSILRELPDKIKTKMKRIHYRYAHLYGEPLYEELMKMGNGSAGRGVKDLTGRGIKEPKKLNKGEHFIEGLLFDEVVATNPIGEIEAEPINQSRNQMPSDEASVLENAAEENPTPAEVDSADTAETFTKENPVIPNIENEAKPTENPVEPVALTGDYWLPMKEKTMEEKPCEPVAEEELTDEEKTLANTEDDAEIAKRIRESDSFFSNFANNAREFARKEKRLEIIQNMQGMKRASQLMPTNEQKQKTGVIGLSPRNTKTEPVALGSPAIASEPASVENASAVGSIFQTTVTETPALQTSTTQTPADIQETESAELFQDVPLNKAELNASMLKSSQRSNSNQTASDASFQQVVSGDDAWAFIQQNRMKMEEAKKAENAEPSPAVKAFQEAYAKDVYRQFQKAGLYQGIDYLYFYKIDFPKGIKTLKERAITVEDQKEAYSLNEVIQAYLAKAKSEKDDVKRNAMAFYKMCEEREYNSLNVVYY